MKPLLNHRTLTTLFILVVLLLSGSQTTTGPTPALAAGPPLYLRLASYTFDPLAEVTPQTLPADLTLSAYPPGEAGYYLLQFHGPIQTTWKDAVTAAGAQIYDYIPDFAFIVKMDAAARAAVEGLETVRWVGLFQPGYRIAPALLNGAASTESGETTAVTVVAFPGEDLTILAGQLQDLGGTVIDTSQSHWKGKIRLQLPGDQIEAAARLNGVKWIEPSPRWELANNEAADLMGTRIVWDVHGLYGAGQIVAVADTGLDQGSANPGSLHDDFEDGSGTSRVVVVRDLVGDGADDVNSGHGTHVAGSVLGNGDLSGSTPASHTYPSTAYAGAAPEASLVFQAIEDNSTESLSGIPEDLNTLFQQAYDDGARIHTNSWGSDVSGEYTGSSQEVDEFVWEHKNFTILFAAGNDGVDANFNGVVDLGSMESPGTAKNCITVGATENNRSSITDAWGDFWPTEFPADPINSDHIADDPVGMAAFSSRGPTDDGRIKPDVVAPGTFVASVRSSTYITITGWGVIDSNYMYMGGTSMATPLTAGAAALVKASLINGATDIYPGQYGTGSAREIPSARPNNVEGWGRVNVAHSLFPTNPRTWDYYDESPGLSTGASASFVITVTDASEPLKITLVWSDYPGTPVADGGLVNDLDLTLTAPNGTTTYPNGGTSADRINNVENIDLASPSTGVYTATVRGYNVPHGPQPYALVVSGAIVSSRPGTYALYLPVVLRDYGSSGSASGPTPGLWESTYEEFYVTTDRAYVDDFAVYINVDGCDPSNWKITHLAQEPISNDQFSFTGSFYASGTFHSETTASGQDGLDNFYISGCGYVSSGPWSWSATWRDSSQPSVMPAHVVAPDDVTPAPTDHQAYRVIPLD